MGQAAIASRLLLPGSKRGTHERLSAAYQEQRYQIYALKKAGLKQAVIIGVDKATISRELKRNSGLQGYRPQQAQALALGRRTNKFMPRINANTWRLVEQFLRKECSVDLYESIQGARSTKVSFNFYPAWGKSVKI